MLATHWDLEELKGEDVRERMPVVFGRGWEVFTTGGRATRRKTNGTLPSG